MQLRRFLPVAVIAGCFSWSSHIGGLKFIPIYEGLTIRAQKNSPPHVAFEETNRKSNSFSEWQHFQSITPMTLAVEKKSAPLFAKKITLAEMVITKKVEVIEIPQSRQIAAESEWFEQLPPAQRARVQAAQMREDIMDQDWNPPTWTEMAQAQLRQSGVIDENGKAQDSVANNKVYVSGRDASGKVRTGPDRPYVYSQSSSSSSEETRGSSGVIPGVHQDGIPGEVASLTKNPNDPGRRIVGPIEITGGLAVTNEHHIEIRRNDEGIIKELGSVDLMNGTYSIDVEDTSGSVVAKLVTREGKILGEGSFRLAKLAVGDLNFLQGPKIKVEPHADYGGVVASVYNTRTNDAPPPQTRVTMIKGATDASVRKDGTVSMDNVTKGSTTVLRAAAPKHLQTNSIITSGQEFRSNLYPVTMINALLDIVGQQRAQSFDGAPTVIWGRVALDGKTLSGIEVNVESDPSLQAVYFNQFMLPDPSLTKTSDNGLFAFVAAEPGFHSLLATRGDSILGYSNVVVEEGAVAQGDIDSTIKNDSVPLRVFDAFTGESRPATLTLQSLPSDLTLESGSTTVMLPHLNRLGLMRVHPDGADYIPARYLYNDNDEFIHVPLIKWEWLRAIKTYLKVNEMPSSGIVVGFVPDENFEVYVAGNDNFEQSNIVYFDMQGRILQNHKGIAGGGFILYNVGEDTQEIVVVGARTQKIYSRVVPVDPNSLSVLSFRE